MPISRAPSWTADLDHLNALSEAVLVTDTTGVVVFANATASQRHVLAGHDDSAPDAVTLAGSLLPHGETDLFAEIVPGSSTAPPGRGGCRCGRSTAPSGTPT